MAQAVSPGERLSCLERSLVTLVQASFPLVSRPFEALGRLVGSTEAVVLEQVTGLKEKGFVRKIGPVFEPARFGISSELMAVQVTPEELARVGAAISVWRPVTHCYARDHSVNLWLAALSSEKQWFEQARAHTLGMAGVKGVWRLPALRRFKVAVRFDLTGHPKPEGESPSTTTGEKKTAPPARPISGRPDRIDLRLLAALEADLPLCPEPFSALAQDRGLEEATILGALQQWTADGRIRRYGALVRHMQLGFVANAMTVWDVPPERVETVGSSLASSSYVSHCYERSPFPGFPFNLYAMVHERSWERCLAVIDELSRACGDCRRVILLTTNEFKKSSPRYAELLAGSIRSPEET